MEKLSVIIITRNEEKTLEDCLESIRWADEIILVDQSSADKTVDIAKKFTDKIYITESIGCCEPDRKFAASLASNDWMLYIDADERISPSLKQEIQDLLGFSGKKFDSYFIPRKVFLGEKWIRCCGWYPSYTIRLFKKNK